ncbi:MAG: thiolase family protein [Proteobacteria bacterium]|nr:thiolase family protein [Pseudomonadota bacterium]
MAWDAVLVGIGESDLGKVPGVSSLQLMAQAARAALNDCGLRMADIDGVITTPVRLRPTNPPSTLLASAFGLSPAWQSTMDLAGASGTAMVHQAAMAIQTGQCTTVLCVGGQNLLSHRSRSSAVQAMAQSGVAHPEFELPHGPLVASLYALVASQHMAKFGTTAEQMAEVAVAFRANAASNPKAHKRDLISIADVVASRPITSPLKLLDCSLVSDGAAAFIVTANDRARDLNQAGVRILGVGYGQRGGYIGEKDELVTTGAKEAGARAFRGAGLTPGEIDVAEIYDCFTITVIVELEDLGFCPKGEGGRFVEGGRLRYDGAFPTTTHGGLLSCAHPGIAGGMFHVVQAVRQLRGDAGTVQVEGAETALVHGNGGVISTHCTIILGAGHTG